MKEFKKKNDKSNEYDNIEHRTQHQNSPNEVFFTE